MSINIGNGNKFNNSCVAEKIEGCLPVEKKRFYERHPWISGVLISSLVAFIFLFSFWRDIIAWIEGWF